MRPSATLVSCLALALTACVEGGAGMEAATMEAAPPSASATLRDKQGQVKAQASALQVGDSVRVRLEAAGMAPGAYGAHIHTTGRCDAPDFTTAGPHWNPTSHKHGKDNPQGMHKGDLPNLMVGTDGRGTFEYTIPAIRLSGGTAPVLDADGAAMMVHATADDYRTDPSGNSGARIACGVLG